MDLYVVHTISGWAIPFWIKFHNGGQHDGKNIYLLLYQTYHCFRCIPCHENVCVEIQIAALCLAQVELYHFEGGQHDGQDMFVLVFQSRILLLLYSMKLMSRNQDCRSISCTGELYHFEEFSLWRLTWQPKCFYLSFSE